MAAMLQQYNIPEFKSGLTVLDELKLKPRQKISMKYSNYIQIADSIDSALAAKRERPINPSRITEDNVKQNLDKLMYLYEQLAPCKKKEWKYYSDIERYETLYRKYNSSRIKDKKRVESKKTKIESLVRYIIEQEFDYFKIDIDELVSLQDKLKSMIEDIGAAKELYVEEFLLKDIEELQSKADSLTMQSDIDNVLAEIAEKKELINKYRN